MQEVAFLGSLIIVMLLLSPVSHPHYFVLLLPLITGLMASQWQRLGYHRLGAGLMAALLAQGVAHVVTSMPGETVEVLRDVGVVTYVTIGLWAVALVCLARRPATVVVAEAAPAVTARAA